MVEVEVIKQIKYLMQCFGIPIFLAPCSKMAVTTMGVYRMMATTTATIPTNFMKSNEVNTRKLQTSIETPTLK